jgi:hypothetical protein
MAAGLGFKTFNTGDVLTAADVNGYLMQGVLVFASAAARDAAITSPQEGQYAYLKDSNLTTYYTGSAWATLVPAAIGKVLQVVFASYATETTMSSTTFADTGLTASITPSATTSKVLVLVNTNGATTDAVANQGIQLKLVRTATDLATITNLSNKMAGATQAVQGESIGMTWLDSPSTTSATTYKTQYARLAASGSVTLQNGTSTSTITLMEIGV